MKQTEQHNSIAMKFNTVSDLRNHYVNFAGFTGGWNVLLEGFERVQAFHAGAGSGKLMAVSQPLTAGSWLTREFANLAREVEIGNGMAVLVVDWDVLVKRVHQDALRERLLVMITGCLFGGNWQKAIKFSGRTDGRIRRSLVGVPVGAAYWHPTEEQLASVS